MVHDHAVKFWSASVIFMVILLSYDFQCSFSAMDTISPGQQVTVSSTIVSPKEAFELGFFQPENSTNYYVGIWYKKVSPRTVVWVANGDDPFTRQSMYLTISDDGNLVIIDGKLRFSITNVSSSGNTSAVLLASGNFVLRDGNSNLLWQSFDSTTNTFLPGMKMGYDTSTGKNWSLVSWKSYNDPRLGDSSLIHDPSGKAQFLLVRGSEVYWKSGEWDGERFSLLPEMRSNYIFNFSFVRNQNMSYFTYSLYDEYDSVFSRLLLTVSGNVEQSTWLESTQQWNLFWAQPKPPNPCDLYSHCGVFSSCNNATDPICTCLKGFQPQDMNSWERKVYSQGCKRMSSLQCPDGSVSGASVDRFNALRHVQAPSYSKIEAVQNFKECETSCLKNCSCIAFAYTRNNCSVREEKDLINIRPLSKRDPAARDLYIRLAASEFNSGSKQRRPWIIVASVVSFVVTAFLVFICKMRKRKHSQDKIGENLLSYDFSVKPETGKYDQIRGTTTTAESRKEMEIPFFSFSSVSAATDFFSIANKLGEGGFGPVYKGKLLNNHEVAVKRLSRRSGQGLEELRNEATLMGKLQHKNLVKLLGCCIDGDEKILIYEYLPNKSLDFFLFDPSRHGILDWSSRVRIIEGIAQGLLYLHQFSRVQIIHRDLKASNILLDEDMNPKISDFGMARIFSGEHSQATNRIVGTYGYMSPEYASDGIFSVKSDVFSFGVLLLEILSSKKNTGFYNCDQLHLLGHAWDLWENGRASELMDPVLRNTSAEGGIKRYINIGLLCVQEHASERPLMTDVVVMLSNQTAILPLPKQPAFFRSAILSQNNKEEDEQGFSVNELTVSILNAR